MKNNDSSIGDSMSEETKKIKKVLIGSPVHQRPEILKEFLISLQELDKESLSIQYLFIDDNEIDESSELLGEFSKTNTIIYKSENVMHYDCNEKDHRWNENLIWKVAKFKDMLIQIAIEYEYDYLFLVDSDLVLHPKTLESLISADKDIISNIFWTRWDGTTYELPQVWISDFYTQYHAQRGEALTEKEALARREKFLNQLREHGVYEVGGLGACTLISRSALKSGISFKEIKNVSFWGEDRHFCIRAAALGIPLFVDTHYPAYHIYRESDLAGVEKYKEKIKGF